MPQPSQFDKFSMTSLRQELVDVQYPQADKIILVIDNRNTHRLASLYEAFVPTAVRRSMEGLEIHYTSEHGSWLHKAEAERSVLAMPWVDRRIPNSTTLTQEVAAWARQRNAAQCRVDWRFTTPKCQNQAEAALPVNSARLRH